MTADPHPTAPPDRTVNARRAARFKAARERIRKIVDGSPPLTDEQRETLALLLTGRVPLPPETAEARRAQARRVAHRRWNGEDPEELERLTEHYFREFDRQGGQQ